MLQEITKDDFYAVYPMINKDKLLKIYNFMKERNSPAFKEMYFDKDFTWGVVKINYNFKNNLTYGFEKYKVYIYPFSFSNNNITICNVIPKTVDSYTLFRKSCKDLNIYEGIVRRITETLLEQEEDLKEFNKEECCIYVEAILDKIRPKEDIIDKEWIDKSIEKWNNSPKQKRIELKPSKEIIPPTVSIKEIKDKAYIYGIKIDGELCYIGKTFRNLKERISEHIECIYDENKGGNQQNYLYKAMRECKIGYKFEILYESHNVINNHELEQIEKTLIENIKPKYNYEGVKVPYRFSEDK